MPYTKMEEVPRALRSAGLNLKQANYWASIYDKVKKQEKVTSPAAISWITFKRKYQKRGDKWVIRKGYKGEDEIVDSDIKYILSHRHSPKAIFLENIDAEGKVYIKELIREGSWAHPQRLNARLKVTLTRMQEWVDNFSKNLFKVPIPKRHTYDPEDNRGWVKKIFIEKVDGINVLFGHLDITKKKMQESIDDDTVQDVSVSISNYIDNQGVKHGECLQHVALTVIPHIDNQSGFKPLEAEGYICLEKVEEGMNKKAENKNIESINADAPDGTIENEAELLQNAIVKKRIFSESSKISVVATYSNIVIVEYFGAGESIDIVAPYTYFQIPYTKNLKGDYEFGNKEEVIKKYYYVLKNMEVRSALEKGLKENENIDKQEVKKMEDLEKIQAEKADLEKEKVNLEAKVENLNTKVTELESNISDKDAKIKDYEAKEKVELEKSIDVKVEALVKSGKITPAMKEDVKEALLKSNDDSALLEKIISEMPDVVDLEVKTKQDSKKPKESDSLSSEEVEAETERIFSGKEPKKEEE